MTATNDNSILSVVFVNEQAVRLIRILLIKPHHQYGINAMDPRTVLSMRAQCLAAIEAGGLRRRPMQRSITDGSSSPSETSRQPKPRSSTTPRWTNRPMAASPGVSALSFVHDASFCATKLCPMVNGIAPQSPDGAGKPITEIPFMFIGSLTYSADFEHMSVAGPRTNPARLTPSVCFLPDRMAAAPGLSPHGGDREWRRSPCRPALPYRF